MLLDLFRFLAFTLRPATRSPAVFGWIDVLRAFGAVVGVSGLGVLGRWLDRSIETAEAGPMTPDWLFTVVLPLVGFACLTVFAGTRLTKQSREFHEPVLEIARVQVRRGDAISGESLGLSIVNKRQATATNCQGQISEMLLFNSSESMSVSNWPSGSLQWSPQSRIDAQQESVTDIRGNLPASLDVIHHKNTGFPVNPDPILTNAPQPNSPRFLFAYANDQPLMFAHPPPSSLKVLLSITVKADNTPPVYAVCLFDPVPETHLEYGPPDDKGGRRVSGSVDPFLKVLKVSIAKPSLASFQNPNPDIPNAESAITPE